MLKWLTPTKVGSAMLRPLRKLASRLWSGLIPSRYAPSVLALDPRSLVADGIRGLILDLDNTVVAWNAPGPTEPVRQWIGRVRDMGVRMCIVSNNFSSRTQAIGRALDVPVVAAAVKPIPWGFRRAMALMGTQAPSTALIGDQVFTDILGGNLLGVKTILVEPLSTQEFPTTRLIRRLERLVRTRVVQLATRR